MNRHLEARRVAKHWQREECTERQRQWGRRHDGTSACVQECCAHPDGTPRWIDRAGRTLGPVPPPDHEHTQWEAFGRPQATPWGSYLDETPLPRTRATAARLREVFAPAQALQHN